MHSDRRQWKWHINNWSRTWVFCEKDDQLDKKTKTLVDWNRFILEGWRWRKKKASNYLEKHSLINVLLIYLNWKRLERFFFFFRIFLFLFDRIYSANNRRKSVQLCQASFISCHQQQTKHVRAREGSIPEKKEITVTKDVPSFFTKKIFSSMNLGEVIWKHQNICWESVGMDQRRKTKTTTT